MQIVLNTLIMAYSLISSGVSLLEFIANFLYSTAHIDIHHEIRVSYQQVISVHI